MGLYPAARVTDTFSHVPPIGSMGAGAAMGALSSAGNGLNTGLGAAGVGSALAVGGVGNLGAVAGMLSAMSGPPTGMLTVGSFNVLINGLPATMMVRSLGECALHEGVPQPVTSGSFRVLINGMPAARVTDSIACQAKIMRGSPNVLIGNGRGLSGGSASTQATKDLFGEKADFQRFSVDAKAAAAAYDPPDDRTAPPGYHNASTAELANLGLKQSMLEHPIDRKTGKPSEFRAAVFINDNDGKALVAFKGTTSKADWKTNLAQGVGKETFYYNQAQLIGRTVAKSPGGAGAHLTGHSLGGGLASAASRASGLPATTFNAAGLNARTVPHPLPSQIDAINVKGEVLTGIQKIPGFPSAASTRTYTLDPVDHVRADAWNDLKSWHPLKAAKELASRPITLHGMDQVEPAIANKQGQIEQALSGLLNQ